MRTLLRLLAVAALPLTAAPALAQSNTDTYFYTPGGGGVNGALGMCLNGQNKAVPCNAPGAQAGNVGSYDVAVPVAPTIQAAAYVAGNAVGALQTVSVFRFAAQPSGILNALSLAWRGTETTALTFYVFDTNPTGSTCTDKTAFVLATADIAKLAMPPFTLTAAAPSAGTTSTFANSTFTPISVKNQDSTATTNLYVCAVSGGSFTPAVGDLTYKISVAQD